MKTITASALGIAFLFALSFQFLGASEASVSSLSQITQPTPPSNKPIKEIASPTPSCSPQPTPLSEEDNNNPNRELSSNDRLNSLGGNRDWDCDGICNSSDNCIFVHNPDQKDIDADGKGDACDPDLVDPSLKDSRCDQDRDGVPDFKDNCPLACNPGQKFVDVNQNNVNDLCDDALSNAMLGQKPCPKRIKVKPPKPPKSATISNVRASPIASCSPQPAPLSEAAKNDPDYREPSPEELGFNDSDCDGICNRKDNCVLVYNPDQKDSDKDGHGDVCDPKLVDKSFVDLRCDIDGDGVPDDKDNCNSECNPDQKMVDINGNNIHDACDAAIPDMQRPRGKPCAKRIKVKAPKPPKPSPDK